MNNQRDQELVPLDPEIERTFRARRREQQQGLAILEEMAEAAGTNNAAAMADDRDRAIREYAIPILKGLNPAQVSSLSNILKSMNMAAGATGEQSAAVSCIYCGEGHSFDSCPSNPASVCYMGNFNKNNNLFANT
ncbi:hypothetical protein PanWU01x14_223510, partial [Parasponia andersonii]